jgi:hypothetical protein
MIRKLKPLAGMLVMFGLVGASYSVAPEIEWERTRDKDEGVVNNIEVTSDGGCVAIGMKDDKPWVMKLNHEGDSIWSKMYDVGTPLTFGMPTGYVMGTNIFELPDHGFLCAGVGLHPVFFKLDENGNLEKENERSAMGHLVVDVFQANDGGLYHIQEVTSQQRKMVKYTADLDVAWEKPYPNDFFGSDTSETIYDITTATNGDLLVLGKTEHGGFVARTDADYVPKWAKMVPTNVGYHISEKADGNLAVFCRFDNDGADEYRYVELTAGGDLISSTTKEYTLERGIVIKEMQAGGYAGYYKSAGNGNVLTKFDNTFDIEWTKEVSVDYITAISSYRDGALFFNGGDSEYTVETIGKLEAPPAPAITIKGIADGATYSAAEEIVLDVALGVTGIIDVKYYAGDKLIGTAPKGMYKSVAGGLKKRTANSPYAFVWQNPPVGEHAITAVATISGNRSVTSPMVTISVQDPAAVKLNAIETTPFVMNNHILSINSAMPHTVQLFSLDGELRFSIRGENARQYNLKSLANVPNGMFIYAIRVGEKSYKERVLISR